MRVRRPGAQGGHSRRRGEDACAVARVDRTFGEKRIQSGGQLVEAVAAANGQGGENGVRRQMDDGAVDVVVDEFPTGEKRFVGDTVNRKVDTEFGEQRLERGC